MMLKPALKKAARRIAPRSVLDGYHHLKLVNQARRLSALRRGADDPRVWIDDLFGSHFFRPLQKKSEILRLLEIIKLQSPAAICEIGAAGGGTAFLFAYAARADATIISVDLSFTRSRKAAISRFALPGQELICLQGDSHKDETQRAVRESLRGRQLDVLYIDGDHSYEGVAADFRLYGPLVRPGGMIVFHDIVPDYRTRYGTETVSYTGDVPRFWNEIKAAHGAVEEIIEDPAQDGLGIGVLHWPG